MFSIRLWLSVTSEMLKIMLFNDYKLDWLLAGRAGMFDSGGSLSVYCGAEINGIFANKGSAGLSRSHAEPHLAGQSVVQ